MKQIYFITILILSWTFMAAAVDSCEKCEIEKIKAVAENLDSLTLELTKDFFCTLDKSCQNNVEFSEWSKEILFELLDRNPGLFLTALETEDREAKKWIIKEIESPIHEFDLKSIYTKLESTDYQGTLKKQILTALSAAIKKEEK